MRRGFLAGAFCLALLAPATLSAQVQVKSKAMELTFSGRLQMQGWSSSCSGFLPLAERDSACREGAAPFDLFLRRARVSVQAEIIDFIDLKLELDFSGFDDVAAKDAWARLNFDPALRVRLGNMKRPFDGFQLASSSKILMIERDLDIPGVSPIKALSLDELTTRFRLSNRDVGIELSGDIAGGRFAYWAGYWAGQQIQEALDTLPNVDSRGQWMGRVQARLQIGDMPLDIAVAGAITDRPFLDSDGFTFTGKYFGDLELWLELGDYNGGFHLQGEYVYGQNPFENKQGDILDFLPTDEFALAQTWQAVAGYKIVTRPEAYEGPIRKQPIEAIEPIFRVTWADPNTDIDEDDNWGLTPGVQIFFYGRNKISFNWDFVLFTDGTDPGSSFKLMMQAYF